MNRDRYLPVPGSFGRVGSRLPKALSRLLRTCESAQCRSTGWLRSLRIREADGIRLQGRWYCSVECFAGAARDECTRLAAINLQSGNRAHRIPIGLLMLSRGIITDGQLKRALALQRETGRGRIGEHLRGMQAASDEDIAAGLAAQWGCPVYPLERTREYLHCASLLPIELMETARMLPVHQTRATGKLHLAFVEGIDRSVLYAVEQMLQLSTEPCIVSESALRHALDDVRAQHTSAAAVFDGPLDVQEMVRTAGSYALQVGAREVTIARSGSFLWMRMRAAQFTKDVLFQTGGRIH